MIFSITNGIYYYKNESLGPYTGIQIEIFKLLYIACVCSLLLLT